MIRSEQLLNIINARISNVQFGHTPRDLYDPIYYILKLGGKRLRPILALLSYQLFSDEDIEKILNPALAVETFHNFTLMHDDVMDKAPLRRGKPTIHEKWDVNTAMLSGDVMLVRAYDLFLDIAPELLPIVITKFNDCAARVCEGQQFDMNYESVGMISEKEYLEMIKLKTASLIGFSLELGSILGKAQESQSCRMKECGIHIGMGFQLMDDLLDVYADHTGFGKQIGGDILANKKTYLLIKAMDLAKGSLKSELDHWIDSKEFSPAEKVKAVTAIYNQLNIRDITSGRIDEYFQQGFAILDEINVHDARKKELKDYIRILADRET